MKLLLTCLLFLILFSGCMPTAQRKAEMGRCQIGKSDAICRLLSGEDPVKMEHVR
jgi:hypothetical protein